MALTFGIITDVHWGPDEATRVGSQACTLVTEIVNSYNAFGGLDFIVDLGDRIGNVDYEHDSENLSQYAKVIEKLHAPYYPLLGNHDIRNLKPKDNEKILKSQVGCRTVKKNGVELFFLNAQDPTRGGGGGCIGKEQLTALQNALLSKNGPALVFTHQVLDDQDTSNNIYFKEWNEGSYAYVEGRNEIRRLLESSGRVKAVFQGHLHWNRLQYHSGIPYFTQGSVTETGHIPEKKPGGYYSIVHLSKKGLKVTIEGRYPVRFELSPVELGGTIESMGVL